MSVFFGWGDGTLQLAFELPAAGGPTGVEIADLDGEGVRDLVVIAQSSPLIGPFRNQGIGTFQPLSPVDVGADPRGVALGDTTGGVPDIVLSTNGRSVAVHLGLGDGRAPDR